MSEAKLELPAGYDHVLAELKGRFREAQRRAQQAAKNELLGVYWAIGAAILEQQLTAGWGARVVERLAADLRAEFPEVTGFNRRNLLYMRAFAAAWPEIVPPVVAQLSWTHIRVLLDRVDTADDREWYAAEAVANGWSRRVLEHQIMNRLRPRLGAAPTNFASRLEPADAARAVTLAKDPFVFDFLGLSRGIAERDLEQALMDRIIDTLRELGPGFSFVGRQLRFEVGGEEYLVDLLFFHTVQLRYVVVELKIGRFTPAHAGQLGFYVALVDDRLRQPAHAPTVGILLCTDKDAAVVRYALASSAQPIAVTSYSYESLPAAEREALPDLDALRRAFGPLVVPGLGESGMTE